MTDAAERVGRPGKAPSGQAERWRLEDEREFLQRSLEDAEREHQAGDLADDDYAALRRRDEARLVTVETALTALDTPAAATPAGAPSTGASPEGPAPGGTAPSVESSTGDARRQGRRVQGARSGRRRRRWLALGGLACLLAGAALLVVELASPRLPGQAPTGSIDQSQAQKETQQLLQAQAQLDKGNASQALQVYGQVLTEDPSNPVALAEWGWLEWQAASAAKRGSNAAADGQAAVVKAVKLEPSLYAAQYYLGAILLAQGHPAQAVGHFRSFLGDHPSSTWRADAAPAIRKAFADAGQPVPAGVPASGSAPTSTPVPTQGTSTSRR